MSEIVIGDRVRIKPEAVESLASAGLRKFLSKPRTGTVVRFSGRTVLVIDWDKRGGGRREWHRREDLTVEMQP